MTMTMMVTNEATDREALARLETFFRAALPLASVASGSRAVGWWWYRGHVMQCEVSGDGAFSFDLLDPDTPGMDELVRAAGADAVIDAYLLSPK